jgi:hypothetical protein
MNTFEQLEKAMQDAFNDPVWLDDFTSDVAKDLEQDFKEKLSWTTNLKNEIKTSSEKNKIIIEMPLYGLVIDTGRRPGAKMPPIEAIKGWCSVKAIDLKYAYPIARSIGKKGIKAKPYIKEVLTLNVSQKIIDYIKKTLDDILK